ncbi:hypothetical protein N1851_031530 [Merluccius polli]|uniref:Piezo TM1-24 domain-containing protein n=1 Tax=Merluccius polli TaxID=89951 RepID=A0AA47NPB1_MERPO|nr:hypothetical protein N1851_031530 [Merluccius polli]
MEVSVGGQVTHLFEESHRDWTGKPPPLQLDPDQDPDPDSDPDIGAGFPERWRLRSRADWFSGCCSRYASRPRASHFEGPLNAGVGVNGIQLCGKPQLTRINIGSAVNKNGESHSEAEAVQADMRLSVFLTAAAAGAESDRPANKRLFGSRKTDDERRHATLSTTVPLTQCRDFRACLFRYNGLSFVYLIYLLLIPLFAEPTSTTMQAETTIRKSGRGGKKREKMTAGESGTT